MKFFNIIAALTFSTIMVTQAQAIELVKAEPIVKFSITKAAQASLAETMKPITSNVTSAKFVLDAQMAQLNYLNQKNTQDIAKAILIAE
ncbi:MAG: hypothetical protein HRT54_00170 [Colwellia sp.]|nr:hypothetical protein [Colwellia sp.]